MLFELNETPCYFSGQTNVRVLSWFANQQAGVVMDTLFTAMENERKQQVAPLAVRMRPRTLEDVVGQQDAVGPGSWLRAAIEQDNVSSVILYGPAGTGKTSIAHVIAESTKAT